MPEFKNYVCYSGNIKQLESYAAELIKAGFKPVEGAEQRLDGDFCILTYIDGEFGFFNHTGSFKPIQFTPDQFDEALKAATEPA